EVESTRLLDEGLEIVAHERLAARQVQLDHAEVLGLAEDPKPGRRIQLAVVPPVVERVRAIDAAQRAPVGQLGDQGVRARRLVHGAVCTSPRSAMACKKSMTSFSTSAA